MATRTRGFTFVVYPDSAPANWRDILDEYHIQWAESPLHDKDTEPGTGLIKKAHWHVLLNFDSVKTLDQVKKLIEPLNCTIPFAVNSVKGMVRYFAHLDNPDKFQYPVEQIIGHGGIDIADLLRVSASARYAMVNKMIDYIVQNNVTEFYELMDYARTERYEDWFPLLCDNSAYIVEKYIKSNRMRSIVNINRERDEL